MEKEKLINLIDQTAVQFVRLMDQHSKFDTFHVELQDLLGKFKAAASSCGCIRPTSCGTCRTRVEDEMHWMEKCDDLLNEAINEDRDNDNTPSY